MFRPSASSCPGTNSAPGTAWAPKGTSAEAIAALNRAVNAALADPVFNAQLADLGDTPLAGSPAEFGRLIADDTEKMGKVIRLANINVE